MTTYKNLIICILFLFAAGLRLKGQNVNLADNYFNQGDNYRKAMKMDSALICYKKASEEYQSTGDREKMMSACNQAGIILTRQDKYGEAKMYLEKALSAGLYLPDTNKLELSTTYISLGVVYNAEGNYNQSLMYHNKSLAIRLLKLGENDAQVATSYGNLGNVYRNNKDLDRSVDAHFKAMKIREKIFGDKSPEVIESYVGLGNAYREKKIYNTSLLYFDKALKNKIIQRGEGHKDLARFYKYISDVYYLMENKEQGDLYKNKSEAVLRN